MKYLTSESVTPGHPDKLCDQISDALLDAYLSGDPTSGVAVEVMATAHGITLGGEVTSGTEVDVEAIVRRTITNTGHTAQTGICPDTTPIRNELVQQSPEIRGAVRDRGKLGAGDQGIMFGYACTETAELMPAPIMLAHALSCRLTEARTLGQIPGLRPDGKTQVTLAYSEAGTVVGVNTVVISTQHHPDVSQADLRADLFNLVLDPVLYAAGLPDPLTVHINPAGPWSVGGPASDAGLTGRKIIVDTYGGAARHGGGAFSGKDPSKVDRSASYAARQIARHVVAEGMARRCEVQLSYAIGHAQPTSTRIDTFGTGVYPERDIEVEMLRLFDLTPQGIIDRLGLLTVQYEPTATFGHFGRSVFPWERTFEAPLYDALR